MSAKNYYYQHFNELTPEKQFHFATRMKNYLKTHDFDDFLQQNMPSTELAPIFANNDYSKVNHLDKRKPYFEKYVGLYGIEAALFRVHHLLAEYGVDIRSDFLKLCPADKLYQFADALSQDKAALRVLSTWAINTICLTEELFPRGKNTTQDLSEWILGINTGEMEPTLFVYFCTHIVICESGFYTKDLSNSKNIGYLRKLMERSATVVAKNIDTISLDAALEYLVCCEMVGVNNPDLRQKIKEICDGFMVNNPYLVNYRRDNTPGSYFHTINGAEHINALYIMSGLDA